MTAMVGKWTLALEQEMPVGFIGGYTHRLGRGVGGRPQRPSDQFRKWADDVLVVSIQIAFIIEC